VGSRGAARWARRLRHACAPTASRAAVRPVPTPITMAIPPGVRAGGELAPRRTELVGKVDGTLRWVVPERGPDVPEQLMDHHERQSVQDTEDQEVRERSAARADDRHCEPHRERCQRKDVVEHFAAAMPAGGRADGESGGCPDPCLPGARVRAGRERGRGIRSVGAGPAEVSRRNRGGSTSPWPAPRTP